MNDIGVTDGSAADDGTVSWAELLDEAARRLEGLDARRIVEEITGAAPGELHTVLDAPATVRGVARLDSMVARREAGEPLQYVLGSWGFRTLDLMVDRRVLIPRPETEVVAGLAIDEVRDRGGTPLVVDLGTGSGAIALALAVECPRARVVATDVSSDALVVARANVAGVGRAGT
nr:peptide chain release factor N(5)-glutamine methyltransferase [Actinomycetota bacterium]NIS30744.1 peptide chain release factor N(5)-glutamine methyltransferase [Actinomycetota bacterium]NIT95265.1 peptide chain release factor N(5)-glutamine methyltransferase [Actinomycetota bacterium]NIU18937.1 peptide chain release factor N(5)-glutamine methyltransferase [Actinomycetota bacterium]NIU65956.1 peptide chain release factor N(5)-glutamine methyltransferase [Actinomycetota bacterium]